MKNAVAMIQANFVQPTRQLTIMLAITGLTLAGCYAFYSLIERIFLATPYLNGLIVCVFIIGVFACFWQLIQIYQSVTWLDKFSTAGLGSKFDEAPRLLAPLTSLLEQTGPSQMIPSISARSILDSISSRMDESRDISRYIANLLIFLGLLGTFFGLATTVPAVLDTIRTLTPSQDTTALSMFQQLMDGVETQLAGMGVAFSSSLLGLAGSLVVGLLDLFAGHGQNRFYRELEEWISTITKLGMSSTDSEQSSGLEMLADRVAGDDLAREIRVLNAAIDSNIQENMRAMQELGNALLQIAKAINEQNRSRAEERAKLDEFLSKVDHITQGQVDISEYLQNVSIGIADQETRILLRSIERQLLRIAGDNATIRETIFRRDLPDYPVNPDDDDG